LPQALYSEHHEHCGDVCSRWVRDLTRSVRGAGSALDPPEEAVAAIETLLPTGRGKFLELWASPDARRPGWTHIAVKPK